MGAQPTLKSSTVMGNINHHLKFSFERFWPLRGQTEAAETLTKTTKSSQFLKGVAC